MRVLELFKGTGSFGKWINENHPNWEIVSLDYNKKYNPTICSDIMDWKYSEEYSEGYFDIIWASPDCRIYSALQYTHIQKPEHIRKGKWESMEHLTEVRKENSKYVLRVLDIIEYFQPKAWFIENPWYSAMNQIPEMNALPSTRLDYCRFGKPYKKPTRIWSNRKFESVICNCTGKHKAVVGISSKGKRGRSRGYTTSYYGHGAYSIPLGLFDYIFSDF
jgi:hypothetical protein